MAQKPDREEGRTSGLLPFQVRILVPARAGGLVKAFYGHWVTKSFGKNVKSLWKYDATLTYPKPPAVLGFAHH